MGAEMTYKREPGKFVILSDENCFHCGSRLITYRYFLTRQLVEFMQKLDLVNPRKTPDLYPGKGKASPDVFPVVDMKLVRRVKTGSYCLTEKGVDFLNGKRLAPAYVDRRLGEVINTPRPTKRVNDFRPGETGG